jgi:hypothetical protein
MAILYQKASSPYFVLIDGRNQTPAVYPLRDQAFACGERCALMQSDVKPSRLWKRQCPLWPLLDCEFLLPGVHLGLQPVYDG